MERGAARQDDEADEREKRRSRSRGDGPSTADSSELRDPSAEAQDSMVHRLFSKLEKRIETQWQDTTAALKTTVVQLDTLQRERMQRMEERQEAAEARLRVHDTEIAQQAARLARLEAELAMVQTSPPPRVVIEDDTWSRLPHQHVLRANCGAMASLAAAQEAIDGAFRDVVEKNHYEVRANGKGLSRQWTIEFLGPVATAARRAQKALQAQRTASGTWRRVDALAPDGAYEQIYIAADASPQQLRVEQAGRRVAKALRDRFPGAARARLLRRGVVAVDWHRLARVTAPQRDADVVVEWNTNALNQLGIAKEDARQAVEETDPARASATVAWCL